jgi:hypothetical protein
VAKALSFLAGNIASGAGAKHNYSLAFDGGNGRFPLSDTLILTSAHTVASGYKTTFDVYNGTQAAWSGGLDIAGTWSATTLPSGGSGCVSSYLKRYAPLKEANAKYYAGVAWINGHRVQEVINPRSGNPWAQVPGVCTGPANCPDAGSTVFVGPTAKLTASSAAIKISDLSRVGLVGQPISFESSVGGVAQAHPYWIATKSAATGSGAITVAWFPGGPPLIPTASATINVEDPVQSSNQGDRDHSRPVGKNRFPYDPAKAEFASAYNQTDVKAEIPTYGAPSVAPVFSVSGGVVTLNSRIFRNWNMYPTTGYRVWNRFEDLGAGGHTGELYNDRTTGLLYYTPRADLGESCASINAAGKAIIPSALETLVKISSAPADIAAAGVGFAGAQVGEMTFRNILFEHTNTSVFTGVHDIAGAVGGFITTASSHYAGPLNWAIATIGAIKVTFDNVTMAHFGGSAIAMSWGTSYGVIQNSRIYDAGGALITAGGAANFLDSYHYQNDKGYYGTPVFGPSTPSFNRGGHPLNADLTGASDCCQLFTNNFLYDGGLVHKGMGCMSLGGWQRFTISHNTMHDCGVFGFSAETNSVVAAGPPSYNGVVDGFTSGGKNYFPFYGNNFSYNEIYNCGYETTVKGARVPGGAMGYDFGCIYLSGPQDGDGTGSYNNQLKISFNKVHDISAAAYPVVRSNGTPRPNGWDAILDYHDGNNVNGVIEYNNLFYNRSAAAIGAPTYPSRLAQHTGNLRTSITNNIFAGVFPAGYKIYTDYVPRVDATSAYILPYAASNHTYPAGSCASTCYVTNARNIYSSKFADARTTGNNTPPTCASGACADGGVRWTFERALGGAPYLSDYKNITAWKVTGKAPGATKDYPYTTSQYSAQPKAGQFASNLYSMEGNFLSYYDSVTKFPAWLAMTGATGALQDIASLYGAALSPDAPGISANFVSLDTGDFRFQSTYTGAGKAAACGGTGAGTVSPACGLGFVPWDFSNVGAK